MVLILQKMFLSSMAPSGMVILYFVIFIVQLLLLIQVVLVCSPFTLVSQNLKDEIRSVLAYHTTEDLQELFDTERTKVHHITIGEGCGNDWENDLVFSGFDNLVAINVKTNCLMNLKSVRISDNPQLEYIFVVDDSLKPHYEDLSDLTTAFLNVESIVIESMNVVHLVDWIFLNFVFLFSAFKKDRS